MGLANIFKKARAIRAAMLFMALLGLTFSFSCSETEESPKFSVKDKVHRDLGTLRPLLDKNSFDKFLEKDVIINNPKNIVLIFADTLRADKIDEETAPFLNSLLKNKEVNFKRTVSPSTITHNSGFSMYYSLPGYQRDLLFLKGWNTGSPFLQLLQKAGYRISVYGSPWKFSLAQTHRLFDKPEELKNFAESNLQILYGQNPLKLVNGFMYPQGRSKPGLEQKYPEVPFTESGRDGIQVNHQAYMDQQVVYDFLDDIAASTGNKNYYELCLFSAHYAYAWPDRGIMQKDQSIKPFNNEFKIRTPNIPWSALGNEFVANTDIDAKINSYKNGVAYIDYLIKEVVQALKNMGKYDDTLLVIFSDHGEFLHDVDNSYNSQTKNVGGHCCTPWYENTTVPLLYKFPGKKDFGTEYAKNKMGSGIDIFPTIFDVINYQQNPEISKLFAGKSIFKSDRECAISFSPKGTPGPRTFGLFDKEGNLYHLYLDNHNVIKSRGVYFLNQYGPDRRKVTSFNKNSKKDEELADRIINDPKLKPCLEEIFYLNTQP